MKKILSFAMVLMMLCSVFAFNASAASIVQSNFDDMALFTQHFHAGAFYTDGGLLFGYDEAKCLQSKSEWYTYDTTIEVSFADDELSDNARGFSMWYCNTNLENYGRFDGTDYMRLGYDIDNKVFYLTADDPDSLENVDLVERVPYELSDDEFYTFGLSVTRGRLRGFIDGELVIDYIDTDDTYLIGLNDKYTISTPLVFWNDGNFIQISDVKIADAEYFFPLAADEPVEPDASTTLPIITGDPDYTMGTNEDPENTDVNDDPEYTDAEPVESNDDPAASDDPADSNDAVNSDDPADSDKPANTNGTAATNQQKPQGGNSATTGDTAFVVVAAMVAALGCAIIVKKVNAR